MDKVPVWPSPIEAVAGDKVVWITSDVSLFISLSELDNEAENSWIEDIREDFQPLMFKHAFTPEKLHPLNEEFEPPIPVSREYVKQIIMTVVKRETEDSSEQYTLDIISQDGDAHIECTINSFSGGLYALQTLKQLFYRHSKTPKGVLYTPYAPIHIKDRPRFVHRGLNLDIARNRVDPESVMRTIDGMANAKLNRLHLHATDSQSWPLEIPALPELSQKGAYHPSQVWTCGDLERVQAHGKRRGVEVFLEISMPGHIASIHHSHPELIVGYDQRPWEPWAAEPPSGQLKLNSAQTIDFVKTLLADVLPRVAKFSNHFHIGADEINTKIYELDPGIKSSDPNKIKPALQALVNTAISEIIQAGLTPIAWEELLLDWNLTLPKSTIIQVWRTHESLAQVLQRGHRAIFGPSSHWYLDGGHGGWVDPDPNNKDSPVKPPFEDWCSPYKNWRQICSYDPFEGVPAHLQHLLHGGEASLWGELTDAVTLDGKLWPRAAAAAQVLWTGHGRVDEGMTRRLAGFRERLVLQGLGAGVVQMEWCLRNVGGSLL